MDPRDSGLIPSSHLLGSPQGELLLRMIHPDGEPKLIRTAAVKCTVGSAPGCTIRLPRAGVEPVHCVILRGGRQTLVRRWSEGTRLNGHRFTEAPLVLGDRLGVGPIELEVVSDKTPQTTPLARVKHPSAPRPGNAELEDAQIELARRALDLQEKARQLELSRECLRQQRELWYQTQSSLESKTATRIEQMNDEIRHFQQRSVEQQASYDRLTQQLAEANQARDAAIGELDRAGERHKTHRPQQKKLSLRKLTQPDAAPDQSVQDELQQRVRERLTALYDPENVTVRTGHTSHPTRRGPIQVQRQATRRKSARPEPEAQAESQDHEAPRPPSDGDVPRQSPQVHRIGGQTQRAQLHERVRRRLTEQFEPGKAEILPCRQSAKPPPVQTKRGLVKRCQQLTRRVQQLEAICQDYEAPMRSQSNKSKGCSTPAKSAPEKTDAAELQRRMRDRLTQQFEPEKTPLQTSGDQVEPQPQGQTKRRGRRHKKAKPESRPLVEASYPPETRAAEATVKPSAPSPIAQPSQQDYQRLREELDAQRAALQSQQQAWEQERRQIEVQLAEQSQPLRQEHESLRQEQKSLQQEQDSFRLKQESLRQKHDSLRQEQESFRQEQESLRRERKAWEAEVERRAEPQAQPVERLAEERRRSEEQRSGGERRLDQLMKSLTSQPADAAPHEQQNPVQTPKKDAPVSVIDLLAKRQDTAEARAPEPDHDTSPTKRNIDVRPSRSEDADGDEHDATVQEYLNNLLQRSGGQIIPTATTSHKPKPPSEPAEKKPLPQPSQTSAEALPADAEPAAPEEYRPRSAPPELASNYAAMRALANQMARTAIDQSRQSRWLQAVIFKAMIAGGALVATVLFGRLSERLFSLEFLTAGGAAIVGILFALEALVLSNQIRIVSRRTKMGKGDRANPRAGNQFDPDSDSDDPGHPNPEWASLWKARQRKADGGGTN